GVPSGRATQLTNLKVNKRNLSKQRGDRSPRTDRVREAVGAQAGFGGNAEGMKERGAKVLGRHRIVAHVAPVRVGSAVNQAAANARPGQHRRVALLPVI